MFFFLRRRSRQRRRKLIDAETADAADAAGFQGLAIAFIIMATIIFLCEGDWVKAIVAVIFGFVLIRLSAIAIQQ